VCISGDRTNIPITDAEIRMIGECVEDARARGEVVDNPNVYPHSESFATACPGNKTRERFPEIIAVCQAAAPTPKATWRVPLIWLRHPEGKGTWIVVEGTPGRVVFLSINGAELEQGMNVDSADRAAFGNRTIRKLVDRTRNDGKPGFKIETVEPSGGYVPQSQI